MKRPFFIFLASYLLIGVLLYGRSLNYNFVYDDQWRIVENPWIRDLSNLPMFFSRNESQASIPALHFDNYRPVSTLNFAVDYSLWGLNPFGYRCKNLLLHVLNSSLVGLLGWMLLGLTVPTAFFSGLLFLVHPIQVESVAWIVEQTNLMGTTYILGGLFSWYFYLRKKQKRFLVLNALCLGLGLLTRETVVCLPAACFLLEWVERKESSLQKMRWAHYAGMMAIVVSYLGIRSHMLGQFKIASYWGGSVWANLANVLNIWTLYFQSILWPFSLRVTYGDLPFVTTFFNSGVLLGAALFLGTIGAAAFFFRTNRAVAFCIVGFLLFWLPGSNLVPLMILFAERLMYPMMIFFSLLAGLIIKKGKDRKWIAGVLSLSIGLWIGTTWRQIGVWENEYTLWTHATTVAPKSWFAWVCRGQEEFEIFRRSGGDKEWLVRSRTSLLEAFQHQLPVAAAGDTFFKLAKIYTIEGDQQKAQEVAERAFVFRPDLRSAWDTFRNSVRSAGKS